MVTLGLKSIVSKIDPLLVLGVVVILFLFFSFFRFFQNQKSFGKLIHTPEISTQPLTPTRLNKQREIFKNESI